MTIRRSTRYAERTDNVSISVIRENLKYTKRAERQEFEDRRRSASDSGALAGAPAYDLGPVAGA